MLSSILSFLFLLLLSFSSSISAQSTANRCNEADRAALIAIKSSFRNTNCLASWNTNTSCCSWHGITCDANGHVTSLVIFQDDSLTGTIPPAISLLPFLQILTLRRLPNLVGPIPNSIANLTNLTVLDLSHNSLSGRIPLFITKLTSLTYLDLSYNQLSSPIPGDLPYLSNLTALHLEHNLLYGNIPNTFGRFPKSSPPDLYLCHNALSGLIWPSLGQPNWGVIDISRNRLTGDASILFGSQKRATRIDISRNRFDFDLSNLSFPLNLRVLDFSHNMIHGRIPAQINKVRGLERFNASYNPLCGEIPAGSVTARFGQYSYVHHMCLCGAPLTPCK